jgi:hypothetical protein
MFVITTFVRNANALHGNPGHIPLRFLVRQFDTHSKDKPNTGSLEELYVNDVWAIRNGHRRRGEVLA